MELASLAERFAEAGLVVLLMGIVCVILYRMYNKAQDKADEKQKELTDYIKDSQEKQLETLLKFSTTLDGMNANLDKIMDKI